MEDTKMEMNIEMMMDELFKLPELILETERQIITHELAYEKLVEKVIIAAEVETSMRKLLQEIEKTKRRVNALEFAVIPKMQKMANFIRLRLEEMERESIFRLKRIKA